MTQAFTIDGKAIAAKVRADVAKAVARIKAEQGITPGLAVVLVGEDPASKVYFLDGSSPSPLPLMHLGDPQAQR